MRKLTLILFIILPFIGYAQTEKTTNQPKFGLGLGYNFNSEINDSIRPVEISLHYRFNDKHKVHLYVPLSFRETNFKYPPRSRKQSLYGLGIGYDYTLYTYSFFNFFAGLTANIQWYQNRLDSHITYDVYEEADHQEEADYLYTHEEIYFYWDRIRSTSLIPNLGVRFSLNKVTTEVSLNLAISELRNNSYSYYKERKVHEGDNWDTTENFYPERNKNLWLIQPRIKIGLSYYF